jgi:hypothetical protein
MNKYILINLCTIVFLVVLGMSLSNLAVAQTFGGPPRATVVGPGESKMFNNGTYTGTNPTYNAAGQQTGGNRQFSNIQQVGQYILNFIEQLLIPIIMAIALLVFLFGVLKFITNGEDDTARTQGRQFMFWGLVGLTVMVSVWGLVQILAGTLGERVGIPTLQRLR